MDIRNIPIARRLVPNGIPAEPEEPGLPPPEVAGAMLNNPKVTAIGPDEIAKATKILSDYKSAKATLDQRIIDNEQWYRMQHWDVIRKEHNARCVDGDLEVEPEPVSAWLFNVIASKHADASDNYPEPIVLPREESDRESAEILSEVLPVILENNGFKKTYNAAWWSKLKSGLAIYGVFWDPTKDNGLGDVVIRKIDPLKIYWEPGIGEIQESRNLFIVDLVDKDILEDQYPDLRGQLNGTTIDVAQYVHDDTVDMSEKQVVVDWYYHRYAPNGKKLLHYVKFVGKHILFASENEPEYQQTGWYEDGRYPVVFDVLYPEEGTPAGFGLVDICRCPQLYIDRMWGNILEATDLNTRRKWFVSDNADLDEAELDDPHKHYVHVGGPVDENRLREITARPIDSVVLQILQLKIEEMKDTSSNRDVNNGGASGVTAAAAISAMQEAGNKVSRDMIGTSFAAYNEVDVMTVERLRQFYDVPRTFRITNDVGDFSFVKFSNEGIREQLMPRYQGQDPNEEIYRKPVFDLKISAQRKNPFSRMEQNERAMTLYSAGFFNPEMAQQSLSCLDMMEFEGIEEVRQKVSEGQTYLNIIQQQQALMERLAAQLDALTGGTMAGSEPAEAQEQGSKPAAPKEGGGKTISAPAHEAMANAQTPKTPYMQAMANRATPKM